jgi:hypothetical protein
MRSCGASAYCTLRTETDGTKLAIGGRASANSGSDLEATGIRVVPSAVSQITGELRLSGLRIWGRLSAERVYGDDSPMPVVAIAAFDPGRVKTRNPHSGPGVLAPTWYLRREVAVGNV